MCKTCVDAVREHWPDLDEGEYGRLLWNATAYPFGSAEDTARQVAEMAERSGRDVGVAIAIAESEMDAALSEAPDDPA